MPDGPPSQYDREMGYALVPFPLDRLGPQDEAPADAPTAEGGALVVVGSLVAGQLPCPGPRGGGRRRDRGQRRRGVGGESVDQPGHRRIRGDRTEHLRRGAQLGDVGQAVTADRQRHRQIEQHLARVVTGQRRPPRTGRRRESSVETDRFGGAEQEHGPGVRHDAGAPPIDCQTGITAATILHQKGAPVPARLWS